MKQVPNDIITTLDRLLPLVIANIDRTNIQSNPRLANAIRIIQRNVIPRLAKINNKR